MCLPKNKNHIEKQKEFHHEGHEEHEGKESGQNS